MEPTDFLFSFIGTINLVLAIGFIYYAIKNAIKLKSAVTQYLMAIGAFFFVISGVSNVIRFFIFDNISIVKYIMFLAGFFLILLGEICLGMTLKKVVGKKSWLTLRTISHGKYRLGAILVVLLFTIPLWTLRIIAGPATIYGMAPALLVTLSFVLFLIGEKKLYVATNVFLDATTTVDGKEINLLRDDIVAVRIYADIVNTFLSFGKSTKSAIVVYDTLSKWSEEHPVLFENYLVVEEDKIDVRVVIQNLDRVYEKSRVTVVLKEFSTLTSRLFDIHSSVTSSEYAKERLEESYRAVKKQYSNTPIIFDILRTMPEGVLEEEKLVLLNRDELEGKVKERTVELVNVNKELQEEINGHKKTEIELRESEEFSFSLLNSSPNPIIVINPDTSVKYVNSAIEDITGFSSTELIGKKVPYPWWTKETMQKIHGEFEKAMKHGAKKIEELFKKKDGTHFWVEITSKPVRRNRELNYCLANWVDITERKKVEEKIKHQNIQLKKLDRIKTDFLNVTSHELRTPMSSIKGYIQMLLRRTLGEISDEQKSALEVILRNTNRLDHLIQDILDISRLESGTMKFIPEKTDISKIIKEVAETMQPSADLKNIKINTKLEELPELIIDQVRIKQVLMNLVDNSIKFSSHDSTINLYTKMKKDNVLFEVQDFGRGIPKNKQKKIFERFYQVESGMDREFGGVGLGLTISQGIVNAHGGRIWIDSTMGKGSAFKFSLPLKRIKDPEDRFKEIDVFNFENNK